MPSQVRTSHIDGLLWFYSHLGTEYLDVPTVACTFFIPEPLVKETFLELSELGLVRAVDEDVYRLTDDGLAATRDCCVQA